MPFSGRQVTEKASAVFPEEVFLFVRETPRIPVLLRVSDKTSRRGRGFWGILLSFFLKEFLNFLAFSRALNLPPHFLSLNNLEKVFLFL